MPVAVKEITIAHSPDSDDAFMFYALAKDKLNTGGLKVNQVLKDIQSLNVDAINGKYEVSAISFAAYPSVAERYALMPCGASIGFKYGPILVANKKMDKDAVKTATVAIPGKLTTAYLVLQLWQSGLNVVEMPFDQIQHAVKDGSVDAGLIIHEGQLTFGEMGLEKIVDLGEWWFDETGLPLPLGGNVVRKDLGPDLIKQATKLLQASIVHSLEHRQEALDYALEFAREMGRDLADKFVGMYVNDFTVDYGEQGREALKRLFAMAYEKGVIKEPVTLEFVSI
jgi:1,4-dihydroxy-6-naphthoate synthase